MPADVARPSGLSLGAGNALFGTSTSTQTTPAASRPVRYLTLAGPRRWNCSGQADGQDEIAWALLTAPANRTHQIVANYDLGQGLYPAGCAYLAAAGRTGDARAWARHIAGESLAQCRAATPDLPGSATARPVRLSPDPSSPFAVVIHAPRGAERVHNGFDARRSSRTTTPTLSVAIMSWTNPRVLHFPMTQDCSLPRAAHSTCVHSNAVFVDEVLQSVYGWSARDAAAAARKVAAAS